MSWMCVITRGGVWLGLLGFRCGGLLFSRPLRRFHHRLRFGNGLLQSAATRLISVGINCNVYRCGLGLWLRCWLWLWLWLRDWFRGGRSGWLSGGLTGVAPVGLTDRRCRRRGSLHLGGFGDRGGCRSRLVWGQVVHD